MNLATLQSQFAKALHYRASGEECNITGNRFDADERIQIYRNNFIISLSDVLSATYPMLEALLGKECFEQIARQHVLTHPLTEGQVAHYGESFQDTLTLFAQVITQAPYSPEVARFEWEIDLVRQAQREQLPDTDLIPLTRLSEVNADQQSELIFHLHPGCRAFESRYAVFDLFTAIQRQDVDQLDINLSQYGFISADMYGGVLCRSLDIKTFQLVRCLEQLQPLDDIPQSLLAGLNHLMQLNLINGFTLAAR